MNNQCRFSSAFATVIFVLQAILGVSGEAVSKTAEEIESYVYHGIDHIRSLSEEIVQVPQEEQTFENTLRAWNRLRRKYADIMHAAAADPQIAQEFYALMNDEVFHNIVLQNAIISYAQRALEDETLNPYQRYVVQNFLNSAPHVSDYVYLPGIADSKRGSGENLTILNFDPKWEADLTLEGLLEKVLNEDADVVCLQEIIEVDSVYDLLKDRYAHFYTTIDGCKRGVLVASKYPMDNPHYRPFSVKDSGEGNGFIDFKLSNGDTSLGHVYIATRQQSFSDAQSVQLGKMELEQVLEAMESEYEEDVSFLLCNEGRIILCEEGEGNDRNWIDFSAGKESDSNGNERVYGGVGYTFKNGGRIEVSGGASKDSNGNTSHQMQGQVSIPIGGK